MKLNHYAVASFIDITWDSELPGELYDFLEENKFVLQPLREGIIKILRLNDIKNIELLLRSKIPQPEGMSGNRDSDELDFYRAKILDIDLLERFLQDPFIHQPEEYPDFMVSYFEKYTDNQERYDNIEELYISHFEHLRADDVPFFRFYGTVATTMRTVLAAMRIMRKGLDLEENLRGDPYIVSVILEHRTTSDFGLKSIFPEIPAVIALFEKNPLELEHELDRIRFKLMEDVGQEAAFADYVIYAYIIRFQLRNRWNTLNRDRGYKILEEIVKG